MTAADALQTAVNELTEAIENALADAPVDRVRAAEHHALLLLDWLGFLKGSKSHGVADPLLEAVHSSVVEVAGYLGVRMVRPAVHALRCEFELTLAWLYYNDHPKEWERVNEGDGEFIGRANSIKYLNQHSKKFSSRFKMLRAVKRYPLDDPYDLLCSHVHGTSGFALATGGKLTSLVQGAPVVDECLLLQSSVSEYLNDVLTSWFGDHWHDLPQRVRANVADRLGEAKLKDFSA